MLHFRGLLIAFLTDYILLKVGRLDGRQLEVKRGNRSAVRAAGGVFCLGLGETYLHRLKTRRFVSVSVQMTTFYLKEDLILFCVSHVMYSLLYGAWCSLERFLNGMLQAGVVSNGVLSESASQEGVRREATYTPQQSHYNSLSRLSVCCVQDIWSLRENVPVALARLCRNGSSEGPLLFKYDISVPRVGDMLVVAEEVRRDFLADGFSVAECHDLASSPITQARSEDIAVLQLSEDETRRRRECVLRLYCYGHAGDQNLHLNVMLRYHPKYFQSVFSRVCLALMMTG